MPQIATNFWGIFFKTEHYQTLLWSAKFVIELT